MSRRLPWLALLLPGLAAAYPISPRTLWELTAEAEVVVVATVERLHPGVVRPTTYAAAEHPRGGQWARLRVEAVVVGEAPLALDVRDTAFIVCPAPPRFVVGKQVVAFLSRHAGEYRVVGLSYGTLYPTEAERPLMVERIRAARALQQRGPIAPADRLEWLVATAERRATRWHGLYPLAGEADDHARYDRTAPPTLPRLSPAHRARLARGFVAEPSTDTTLPMMLLVLEAERQPGLDAALVGAFEAALGQGELSAEELKVALELLLDRFGSGAEAEALLRPLRDRERPERSELEDAWRRARERLPIPPGAPVEPTEATVRGVGQDTPF